MHVASASAMTHLAQAPKIPEKSEGPGPDHDGDGDDAALAAAGPTTSAAPSGMGKMVNVMA